MKTNDLIAQLADDLQPSKPLRRTGHRFSGFLILSLFCALLPVLSKLSVHEIIGTLFSLEGVESLFILLSALSCGLAALYSCIPGDDRSLRWSRIGAIGAMVWSLFLLVEAMESTGRGMGTEELECSIFISFVGVAPLMALLLMIKRGAPVRPGLSGILASVSSFSFGALSLQFLCPFDKTYHEIIFHLLPITLLAGGGLFGGKRLLKW